MTTPLRRPVSARHAFALAFDLAVRRDALQSLIVPLLLRSPWIVALALLPSPGENGGRALLLWSCAALGDTLSALTVDAMLRVRARSVFQTPLEVRPGSALESYAQGLSRVPWLFVTEMVRRFAMALGALFLFVPGIWFAFRLAFATESVVLSEKNTSAAFRHSFRLTAGRFERWLELTILSLAIVLAGWFGLAAVMVAVRAFSVETWGSIAYLAAVAVWPILQYAWTFFYLRLAELERPPMQEVGPAYAWGAGAATREPAGAVASGDGAPVAPIAPPDPTEGGGDEPQMGGPGIQPSPTPGA